MKKATKIRGKMKTELTWQDIKAIVNIADALLEDPEMRNAVQNHGEEYYYTKILEEYKKTL